MRARVRPVGGMPPRVQPVLAGRGELARADRALEGFLARVDTLVFRQVALLTKTLATSRARKWLLT